VTSVAQRRRGMQGLQWMWVRWPMGAMARWVVGVVGVVVAGALVGCGDDDGGSGAAAGPDGPAGPVVNEDHWHAAFGVYICDEFLPALPESETALGIHTHGDGVIHIHPFTAEAAGENATLRVFLDSVEIDVTDDELTVDGETYTEGDDTCDGGEGRLEVVRWADVAADDAAPERADADARLREDGEGYVLAFVADGTDVPPPESAEMLAELGAVDSSAGDAGAGTTEPTAPTTADGPPVVTDDRTLADGFYPVEATEPAPCRSPGMRPDRGNTNCYRLPGEPATDVDVIEDAEAVVDRTTGEWRVDLVFTESGIDAFNDVAAICSQFDPACPVGQVALLVDGEVVTAPTITQPSYERDQIVVSGAFSKDEAEDLADVLTR
jgi:hypothetical protein